MKKIIYNFRKFNSHQVVEMLLMIEINVDHNIKLHRIMLKNHKIIRQVKDSCHMKNTLLTIQIIFRNKKKNKVKRNIYKIIQKI